MTEQEARNKTLIIKAVEVLIFYFLFYLLFNRQIEGFKYNEPFYIEIIIPMVIFTIYAALILLSLFYKYLIYLLLASEIGYLIFLFYKVFSYRYFNNGDFYILIIFSCIILFSYIPYFKYLFYYRKKLPYNHV